MATKQKQSKSRRGTRSKRSGNGRSPSQKPKQYRFAQNVDGAGTIPEQDYLAYTERATEHLEDPDVLIDVPIVKVDSIHLELEDLDVHVSTYAKVLELLELNVGIEAHLGKLKVDIKGVEAQALLKMRLDRVSAIIDRLMTTLDRNPELVESIGKAVEDVGRGAEDTLGSAGQAVEDVGEGAEGALQDVGQGAGRAAGEIGQGANQALGQVGEGAGQAVDQVGEGAGQAVGGVGEGAGQAAGELGQGAGQAVGNLDQTAGNLGEAVGQTVGGVGQAAGKAGEAAGGALGQAVGGGDGAEGGGATEIGELTDASGNLAAPKLAKVAAKTVAKEIGAAASDEAKDLGIAATRKVKAMGERRRQKRAERHNATPAALRVAGELDVNLDEIEGSGAEGRITVGDVRDAAEEN
jgi:hypothetical protein